MGSWESRPRRIKSKKVALAIDFSKLDPAKKIAIIKAMGFTPVGEVHTHECPANVDPGLRCNCVPGPTLWSPPNDVTEYRHETWDERLKKAQARS